MGEELSFDNILSMEEAEDLFGESSNVDSEDTSEEEKEKVTDENPDSLFEESQESVGEEKDISQEDAEKKDSSTSPNLYSSLAMDLKDVGILRDFDDDVLSKVNTAEDFENLIQEKVNSMLDENTRQVKEALDVGIDGDVIKQYTNTINYLNSIDEETIKADTPEGEELRKRIIYQDLVNRKISHERAMKAVETAFKVGNDIDEAIEALKSNQEFYQESYNTLVEEAKQQQQLEIEARKKEAKALKDSIVNDKDIVDGFKLNKTLKQQIYDDLTKAVHKDSEGNFYTAIQKAELDDPVEFRRKLGLVFTLTEGFKNFDPLFKAAAKKETTRVTKSFERTLHNTSRDTSGNLKFLGGGDDDPESKLGLKLDI